MKRLRAKLGVVGDWIQTTRCCDYRFPASRFRSLGLTGSSSLKRTPDEVDLAFSCLAHGIPRG